MNATTRSKIDMFGAYCALFYIIFIMAGWWLIAGFLPAPPPMTTPEEVATLFREDTTRIRIGMVFVMWSALAFMPFAAVVSRYLARIEGGVGTLSGLVLLGGAGNMVLTFYPAIWWLVAAFRPDRAADLTYLINDMAWLQLIGGVSIYDAMPIAIAIAAFCDDSPQPVFPRWAAYFNIMVVLLILPDQLLFFFHSGPFAWNGIFGLWIPVVVFGLFFIVNGALIRAAILRERRAGFRSEVAASALSKAPS